MKMTTTKTTKVITNSGAFVFLSFTEGVHEPSGRPLYTLDCDALDLHVSGPDRARVIKDTVDRLREVFDLLEAL